MGEKVGNGVDPEVGNKSLTARPETDWLTCPPPLVPSTLRAFLRMGWAAGEGFGAEKPHVWV